MHARLNPEPFRSPDRRTYLGPPLLPQASPRGRGGGAWACAAPGAAPCRGEAGTAGTGALARAAGRCILCRRHALLLLLRFRRRLQLLLRRQQLLVYRLLAGSRRVARRRRRLLLFNHRRRQRRSDRLALLGAGRRLHAAGCSGGALCTLRVLRRRRPRSAGSAPAAAPPGALAALLPPAPLSTLRAGAASACGSLYAGVVSPLPLNRCAVKAAACALPAGQCAADASPSAPAPSSRMSPGRAFTSLKKSAHKVARIPDRKGAQVSTAAKQRASVCVSE